MSWEEDAVLFGKLVQGGDFYAGLLVARNVELHRQNNSFQCDACGFTSTGSGLSTHQRAKGHSGRTRLKTVTHVTVKKVSAKAFAEGRTSTPTVLRYLRTWERAAKDGVVPAAETLQPGDEVELPNDEERILWMKYFRLAKKEYAERKRQKKQEEEDRGKTEEQKQQEEQERQRQKKEREAQERENDRNFEKLKKIMQEQIILSKIRHADALIRAADELIGRMNEPSEAVAAKLESVIAHAEIARAAANPDGAFNIADLEGDIR